ncbi:MAG TPA: YihY/virulence factor BrkB family protein [Candidatus Krumholzibacteria bacterium]|nr:YihY/virulence factor BrkB family protein [Candidatus Krumholzibacteria bacterium]HRX51451.1 YihY/virulence factor BrkB family protein [Candidatus Krumholzibacteria bacterium]
MWKRRAKRWLLFLRRLQLEIGYDDCMGMAAQIAYYLMLALFPFLLFLLSLISFLPDLKPDDVLRSLSEALPAEAFDLVAGTVHAVLSGREGGILGLGLLAALWSASMGVGALITTINRAYNIHPRRNIAVQKMLAMALTLALSGIVILSTLMVLLGPRLSHQLFQFLGLAGDSQAVWNAVRLPVVVLLNLGGFSILYFFAPEAKQRYVWILPGTITATVLWFGASQLFRLFVREFGSYNVMYGSIAAVIILLVYLWLSGFIFLLGAEINALMRRKDHYEDLPRVKGRVRKRAHT